MQIMGELRVLCIDDEPGVGAEIEELLALRRIDCRSVTNIEQAREVLSRDPSRSIILTDFHLPGITGAEAIDVLKKEYDRDLAFIVFTGDESQGVVVDSLRAKAHDFLRKPINGRHLIRAIQRAHEELGRGHSGNAREPRKFFATLPEFKPEQPRRDHPVQKNASRSKRTATAPIETGDFDRTVPASPKQPPGSTQNGTVVKLADLRSVDDETRALIRLIDRFAGADGRPKEFQFKSTSIHELLREVRPETELIARDYEISVQFRAAERQGIIHADRPRLARAITEIVRAFAMRLQKGDVLSLLMTQNGSDALIVVKPEPPMTERRMRDALYSDESNGFETGRTTKAERMGLVLAKLIIDLHDGQFEVVRSDVQGITLEIRLPLLVPDTTIPTDGLCSA